MTSIRIGYQALALLVAAGLALGISPAAEAQGGDRVLRRGSCSGRSDWKLDVRREDGGKIRVKLEIEGGAEAQDWHIFLSDNGTRIFAGTRTSGLDGHLEVRVRTPDRPGPDTIKAAANNVSTGETCAGRATI